jgi:hypothetical protein
VNLAAAIEQVDITHDEDGATHFKARLEGETGASLLRAVERYGADFVTADDFGNASTRHADAFARIVIELDALIRSLSSG